MPAGSFTASAPMFPLHDDNPTRITPYVTIALIVACALVFLWQISLDGYGQQHAVFALGAIPAVLFDKAHLPAELVLVPAWATAFTSMFMHGGWMHLIGNMLYLWIFGNNVEDSMGHVRFTFFYLVCGLLALVAHAAPNATSQVPLIGASGAVSGVLGAYLLLYPHARVLVVIPFGFLLHSMRVRAVWVLGGWFVLQLINSVAMGSGGGGGVAWSAHVGGFLAGAVLIPFFKHRSVKLFAPARTRFR